MALRCSQFVHPAAPTQRNRRQWAGCARFASGYTRWPSGNYPAPLRESGVPSGSRGAGGPMRCQRDEQSELDESELSRHADCLCPGIDA